MQHCNASQQKNIQSGMHWQFFCLLQLNLEQFRFHCCSLILNSSGSFILNRNAVPARSGTNATLHTVFDEQFSSKQSLAFQPTATKSAGVCRNNFNGHSTNLTVMYTGHGLKKYYFSSYTRFFSLFRPLFKTFFFLK